MQEIYGPISAEFYDLTKPVEGDYADVPYYLHHLRKVKGRILEAAVGTGRLYVPLLQAGLAIEGLDNSEAMLTYCREHCRERKLKAVLHNQRLEELKLGGDPFQAIIVSFGSFQILEDRKQAAAVLKAFHKHLAPGGRLFVDLDIPKLELHRAGLMVYGTTIECPDGSQIVLQGSRTYSVVDQVETVIMRYERWRTGKLLATEMQKLPLRWYGQFEFASFLRECGFKDVRMCVDSIEELTEPSDSNEMLCFRAVRS